mmetsp:Transcript_26706/g.61527  ORF Transcript_26706/g.61527 Transcript_26706/m.61527 type:complete len:306 (+) Transcript_26706:1033-1950(+)
MAVRTTKGAAGWRAGGPPCQRTVALCTGMRRQPRSTSLSSPALPAVCVRAGTQTSALSPPNSSTWPAPLTPPCTPSSPTACCTRRTRSSSTSRSPSAPPPRPSAPPSRPLAHPDTRAPNSQPPTQPPLPSSRHRPHRPPAKSRLRTRSERSRTSWTPCPRPSPSTAQSRARPPAPPTRLGERPMRLPLPAALVVAAGASGRSTPRTGPLRGATTWTTSTSSPRGRSLTARAAATWAGGSTGAGALLTRVRLLTGALPARAGRPQSPRPSCAARPAAPPRPRRPVPGRRLHGAGRVRVHECQRRVL